MNKQTKLKIASNLLGMFFCDIPDFNSEAEFLHLKSDELFLVEDYEHLNSDDILAEIKKTYRNMVEV